MTERKVEATPRADGRGAMLPQWESGTTGNRSGWHGQGRAKLSSKVVQDFLHDWDEHGAKAIATVRDTKPVDYLKIVAGLLPKHFNVKVGELHELSDEQLDRRYRELIARLEDRADQDSRGEGAAALALPAPDLSPLPEAG
jgi:hypothetical protein